MPQKSLCSTDIIILNVGGQEYTTSRATLTKYPGSMLARMFSGNLPTSKDCHGRYFIDRDGKLFQYVLQYLRTGFLLFPKDVMELEALTIEADFYMLENLSKQLEEQKSQLNYKKTNQDIITLNVGGRIFVTSRKTLTVYPNSLLGRIFSGKQAIEYKYQGDFYFDRDPDMFAHVLQFLRNKNLHYSDSSKHSKAFLLNLLCEARFFKLEELVSACLALVEYCEQE